MSCFGRTAFPTNKNVQQTINIRETKSPMTQDYCSSTV